MTPAGMATPKRMELGTYAMDGDGIHVVCHPRDVGCGKKGRGYCQRGGGGGGEGGEAEHEGVGVRGNEGLPQRYRVAREVR